MRPHLTLGNSNKLTASYQAGPFCFEAVSALCPSGAENTPGLIRGETPLLFALVGLLVVNQGSHEGSGLITFSKALRSPQERDRAAGPELCR